MTESRELFFWQNFPMLFFLAFADTRSKGTGVIDHPRRRSQSINAALHRQWETALQATAKSRQKYPNFQYG